MALDYVKNLREMDATGGEVVRPTAKRSNEDLLALEEATRQQEAENGRYGRFVDQQGHWATAWQAPGRMTPLVPPRFILPATLRRNQTKELVLAPPEGEPMLVEPQQWVVLYDGATEAIVADDDQFRSVMTREDKARKQAQDAAEQQDAPDDRVAGENQRTPVEQRSSGIAPGPAPAHMIPNISIDGFVSQVLQDNARLRFELEGMRGQFLYAQTKELEAQQQGVAWHKDAAHWRTVAEQRQRRINWLEGQIREAMGDEGDDDHAIEAWLADAGKTYREAFAKIAAAEDQRTNGPVNEVRSDPVEEALASAPPEQPKRSTRLSTPPRKEG